MSDNIPKEIWTSEQDDFLKFLHHAGQSFDEMAHGFLKVFKIRQTPKALQLRFYKLKKT